ncbi:hypothetical protein CY35_18G101500 [Sphagnum magellanicum]|nr:hypothetical protein CY35_18G101500 [Sphagnum magellanicum]
MALTELQNIQLHPNHYSSWLAYFGGDFVTSVAENVGVGVHFNAFVPWHNKTIKYGVIGTETLLRDVSTWQRLYISGRLQKPVRYLVDHIRLKELNESNLQSALCAALLLLPSEFSEEDLYATICGLSYTGDVRMFFAEDKNKVRKIVQGSASKFQDLYRGSISNVASTGTLQLPTVFGADLQSRVFQDDSMSSRSSLLSSLPSSIMQQLAYRTGTKFDSTTTGYSEISEAVVCSKEGHAKMVRRAISSVVRASSFRQMVSGFLAAGGINAGQYVAQKVIKAWRSRQ